MCGWSRETTVNVAKDGSQHALFNEVETKIACKLFACVYLCFSCQKWLMAPLCFTPSFPFAQHIVYDSANKTYPLLTWRRSMAQCCVTHINHAHFCHMRKRFLHRKVYVHWQYIFICLRAFMNRPYICYSLKIHVILRNNTSTIWS